MTEFLSPSGRWYRWPAIIAELRKQPGAWRRLLPNQPAALEKYVRLKRHRALRMSDGYVEATVSFRYTDRDGHERGDILLRFVPHERKEP